MKRIHFYTVLVFAILLVAAFIFWHYSSQSLAKKNSEETSTTNNLSTEINTTSAHTQIPHGLNQQSPQTNALPNGMPDQQLQKLVEAVHAQSEKMVAERSKPIAFYGKVVDEATQAVADANVHFIWIDPKSTSESDTTSAADGSFSLTGVVGGDVSVYVWKTGYYEIKSLDGITFNNTGNSSSRENPVLFHLRKKGTGTDLITSKYGVTPYFDVHVPIDGTTTKVDFLNRSAGNNGQMELSNIKPEYLQARQASEWSFKMEIPDGGFVEENDEFPFEAPENGYQPIVQFDFQKAQPGWTDTIQKDYYIEFGNPPRYGYLHLETSIGSGVRIKYAINPNGSRYLEPK